MGAVPYQKTPVSPTQMKAALVQVFPSWGDNALAVLGAMWHLETGGGASEFNYNPAGVSAYGYSGNSVTPPHMTIPFRAYPDIVSGVVDWTNVLGHGYPGAMQAAANADLASFTNAVCGNNPTICKYCACSTSAYSLGLKGRYAQWLASTPAGPVALQVSADVAQVTRKMSPAVVIGGLLAAGAAYWYLWKPRR